MNIIDTLIYSGAAGLGLGAAQYLSASLYNFFMAHTPAEIEIGVGNPLIDIRASKDVIESPKLSEEHLSVYPSRFSNKTRSSVDKIAHLVEDSRLFVGISALRSLMQKIFGVQALSPMDSGSNLSAVGRTRLGDVNGSAKEAGLSSKVYVLPNHLYASNGLTTIASCLVQGPFKVFNALKKIDFAKESGDAESLLQAQYSLGFGGFQTVGGAVILAPRVAGIAGGFGCSYKPLMQTAALSGMAVGPAFGAMFAVGGVWSGDLFMKSHSFCTEWNGKEGDKERLEMLIDRLNVKKAAPIPAGNDAKQEAYNYIAKLLQFEYESLIDLGKPVEVSDQDWDAFIKLVKNTSWKEMAENALKGRVGLEALGQKAFDSRQKEIMENSLGRIIGGAALAEVKKAAANGLFERLSNESTKEAAQKEMQALLAGVKKGADKNWYMNLLGTIMCIFLVAPSILAYVLLDPLSMFVMNVASLIGYGLMTVFDGVNWIDDMKAEGPIGKHDKKFLAFQTVFAVLSIAVTIALTVMTGGIFPVALLVILSLFWLGTLAISIYCVEAKDRRYQELHPSLAKLSELLQVENAGLGEAKEMLLKIPESQREAIYQKLLTSFSEGLTDSRLVNILNFKTGEVLPPKEIGAAFYKAHAADEVIQEAQEALYKKLGSEKDQDKASWIKWMQENKQDLFYEAIYDQMAVKVREVLLEKVNDIEVLREAVEKSSSGSLDWNVSEFLESENVKKLEKYQKVSFTDWVFGKEVKNAG